jgi:hypothetical protein
MHGNGFGFSISKRALTAVALGFLLTATSSCGILIPSKQAKVERKQAKEAEKSKAEYDKAIEAHMKNQSDETRKMMKKTRKKAKGFNKFMKKPSKTSPGCD